MWQTPKTDWNGDYDSSGKYVGDYFDYEQYNRVKDNIDYLKTLALSIYKYFEIGNVGPDKIPSDMAIYANEVNNLEDLLDTIKNNTYDLNIGDKRTYYDNGKYIDFVELNRIENACLSYYNFFNEQLKNLSSLPFSCGSRIGDVF